MKRSDWQRFDARSVDAFMRLVGAALVACVATDAWGGAWRVHGGELFPWRHLAGVPLYSRGVLVVELALGTMAGLALLCGIRRKLALHVGIVATVMGLSQRFSNHRSLLLIVLVFVALAPPATDDRDFASRERPNLALVRAELLLVYAFSAANKIVAGFAGGDALVSLFGFSPGVARVLSVAVVVAEVIVPALLLLRPRTGVAGAIALHVAMAVLLPSVWPFTLTMIAMAVLFVPARASASAT